MKPALALLFTVAAAAPVPYFEWWNYSVGLKDRPQPPQVQPKPKPKPYNAYPPTEPPQPPQDTQPDAPAVQPTPEDQPARPSVYQNSTDWWVPGSVFHAKWKDGQWDGVDNTAGAWMYVNEENVAVTIVPV